MIKIKINSSLTERKSDLIYGGIVDYFYNILKNPKDFMIDPLEYKYTDKTLGTQIVPSIQLYNFQPSNWNAEYEHFKKYTGDDNKIIRTVAHFIRMMKDFNVIILPEKVDPNNLGTMNKSGIMKIFVSNWNVPDVTDVEEHIKKGRYYRDNKIDYLEATDDLYGQDTTESIKNAIEATKAGRFADMIREVLVHEIGHYINAVRSSGDKIWDVDRVSNRASAGRIRKKKKDKMKQYSRSTEEWQARFSEVFHTFQLIYNMKFPNIDSDLVEVEETEDEKRRERIVKYYKDLLKNSGIPQESFQALWSLKKNNFQEFLGDFTRIIGNYDVFIQHLTPKEVARVKTRIYTAFTDYKEKFANHPIYKVFNITFFPSW